LITTGPRKKWKKSTTSGNAKGDSQFMEKPQLYHILYADEMRLDSLNAQLHGVVPVSLTQEESESRNKDVGGEVGMPSVASGHRNITQTTASAASTQYAFRDSQYFKVIEEIGIDLKAPFTSLPFPPDGELHAFRGKLRIVSLSSGKPLVETIQVMSSEMKRNPEMFGLKPGKETTKTIANITTMTDIILKVPAPPAFRLFMENGDSLYGPVVESAVRLPLVDQIIIFGSALPFEWTVVGYLYPVSSNIDDSTDAGFLFQMANALESMRPYINPQASATLIPLLILR
jgi:hypothetical protein